MGAALTTLYRARELWDKVNANKIAGQPYLNVSSLYTDSTPRANTGKPQVLANSLPSHQSHTRDHPARECLLETWTVVVHHAPTHRYEG